MEHIRGIRERIGQGGSVFGTFLAELRAIGAVSAMASGGLDFFMVDMEHGNYDVSEARRLIAQGGAYLNDVKVTSVDQVITRQELGDGLLLRAGKKRYHRVIVG